MAKKRMQMAQKSWKIEEIFPRFVNAQMAKGVSDKTVLIYTLSLSPLIENRTKAPGAFAGGLLVPWGLAENYLCTLAPAPPMMASTSLREAMVVSPGVVMASAPWAAP